MQKSMFKSKSNQIGFIVFLVVLLVYFIYQYFISYSVPDIAFSKLELYDLNEQPVKLNITEDKVLISCGASWCTNCRSELKNLEQYFKENPDKKVRCIVISNESPEVVERWKNKYQYPFEFYLIANEWPEIGIKVLPTNFLISSDFKIIRKKTGEINPSFFENEIH
jgi:thiol-disulfide isomerase/thioredoxin